jgi:hypothetical protein
MVWRSITETIIFIYSYQGFLLCLKCNLLQWTLQSVEYRAVRFALRQSQCRQTQLADLNNESGN